jgi:hypothetical protein
MINTVNDLETAIDVIDTEVLIVYGNYEYLSLEDANLDQAGIQPAYTSSFRFPKA